MRFYLKLFLFIAAFGILARISDPEARASMRDAVLTGRFVMYSFTRSEEGMKDPKWLDSIVTEEQRARYGDPVPQNTPKMALADSSRS